MLNYVDGWSTTLRVEACDREPLTFTIRHFQLSRFILEGERRTLRHNEHVVAQFNFVIDGKVTFLRLPAQIKLDTLNGIGLGFGRHSLLRQLSLRLLKAERYKHPYPFLSSRDMLPLSQPTTGQLPVTNKGH